VQQRGARSSTLAPDTYDPEEYDPGQPGPGEPPSADTLGQHWVDDLAMEVVAEVESQEGELSLMLVRSGVRHLARINLADGKVALEMVDRAGQPLPFVGPDGNAVQNPTAITSVKGPGSYRLKLANCDHQMVLWVNGSPVEFDGPTSYDSPDLVHPVYSAADPGDLAPAGVAAKGTAAKLSSLKVYRDKYYIATDENGEHNDYDKTISYAGAGDLSEAERILTIFASPELWGSSNLFDDDNRRHVEFVLEEDQFLPMGDNSPQSYDGRFWLPYHDHHYVERDLLIGKALLIYWPHTWNRPIPFTPNFSGMGPIK
jgi:signal peptidase I